jgi:hypothetical protein
MYSLYIYFTLLYQTKQIDNLNPDTTVLNNM